MKTIIDVRVVSTNAGSVHLKKGFGALIPWYPGMFVSGPVLKSNDKPMKVQSVMIELPVSPEDGSTLNVHLEDYKTGEDIDLVAKMFKDHGWQGYGEST